MGQQTSPKNGDIRPIDAATTVALQDSGLQITLCGEMSPETRALIEQAERDFEALRAAAVTESAAQRSAADAPHHSEPSSIEQVVETNEVCLEE